MKKLIAVVLTLGLLAGCSAGPTGQTGTSTEGPGNDGWTVEWVDLLDGTEVRCVVWWAIYKGGPSCDWANVRPKERSS